MPTRPGPAADRDRLAAALGVTRVARLTGLDRTGVEVASAVRPGGHVLQVTNGKGLHREEAERGALLEAAELWGAEQLPPPPWPEASARELREHLGPGTLVLSPSELGGDGGPEGADGLRCAWRPARPLAGRGAALVPLDAVHCPPPSAGPARAGWARWTSSGMGAHPVRSAALLHALLEAAERDQLARALPDGFTGRDLGPRLLDPGTLARAAPGAAALRRALLRRGFRVHLLDLAPSCGRRRRPAGVPAPVDLGLPVAAAVILDEDGGPVPVAAGYACRLGRDEALQAALLEAAQSRATEIHGAREEVAFADRTAAAPLATLLDACPARRDASALPDLGAADPARGAARVIERLRRAGFARGAVADLAAPPGLAVVKVLVPGLLLSELLC